jgi:hypothetical protein
MSLVNVSRKFRSIWKFLVPGWLQSGQGELVLFVQGLLKDAFAERAHQTARLHAPSLCPSDALDFHGRSRALPRGFSEPEASYRARLVGWRYPEGHRTRGTAGALLAQVSVVFDETAVIQTIDARGTRYTYGDSSPELGVTWDWDGEALTPNWSRYWIVIAAPASATLPLTWDQDEDAGTLWDEEPDKCWAGEGVHSGQLAAVRTIAQPGRRSWSPAGCLPTYAVMYFDGEDYPEPDGTWDEWGGRPPQNYAFFPLNATTV